MTLQEYISKINTLYITGNAREHSYRGDLQNLLMTILPDILVTNEPAQIQCGAPDYVLTRKDVPVGYIEAKDIGVDLASKTLKEQFDRYKAGLNNLIFTDYLEFLFYKDASFITSVRIAKIVDSRIVPMPENFDTFTALITNFAQTITQTIKSPTKLAEMMAGKAKLMADVIEKSLNNDDELGKHSNLSAQMQSFKMMLIHDITNKSFADIYAQTIAYGMFAARYHDPTLPTFSRQEAATLIPKSNPFLRKLFQDIAGYDLDERLVWIVDELVQIFLATDVAVIMKNFGKSTKQEDPVVHFYETFLASYNPALRKARGVWYTPQPVVNFIVRAVDDILKTEFGLKDGLADTSKIKVKTTVPKFDDRSKGKSKITGEQTIEKEIHRVQILDPATGTGTFLAEVVRHIHKKFEGQQGIWSKYVTNDLIPRLNGFELLMASYAMAHLKMDMLLTETGYKPTDEQRLRIFLTNSLEEAHPDTQTLFSSWLSDEADQANAIKRDSPVMVVIGNPPYSGVSTNKSDWIQNLINDYKYIDGVHFNERKHWLNDDYVKFIRFGQHFIDKNGGGVLAFINPHGFLDNPTFRGMRWNLLQSFDSIYTIDLHGNSKKNEVSRDGSLDQNVFDIMQGVSINFFIRNGSKQSSRTSRLWHFDLFGKREFKYDFLLNSRLENIQFTEIYPVNPNYFFVPKSDIGAAEYEQGFKIDQLFTRNVTGIVTMGDGFVVSESKAELIRRLQRFVNNETTSEGLTTKYNLGKNYAEWISINKGNFDIDEKKVVRIAYRLFDDRYTYFDNRLIWRWRIDVMSNFIGNKNYGIEICRQLVSKSFSHVFITNKIVDDSYLSNKSKERGYVLPLYIYDSATLQHTIDDVRIRTPNLNPEIINTIAEKLNHAFLPDENIVCDLAEGVDGSFSPLNILDYIYAVLHSPSYREKYKEFLKIDFPRVPYPEDQKTFWQLVELGGELRGLHLLESDSVEKYTTQYPVDGDNIVGKPKLDDGKVYINETQYFSGVPESVWNFYIGGYQPAQKWLKDRKGRELSMEDIFHYQKMVVALSETGRIMGEIDKIEI